MLTGSLAYGPLDRVRDPPRTPLAERVRMLRKKAGITQERLADLAGMSRLNLIDIERGNNANPKQETLRHLADALGTSMDDLTAASGRVGPEFLAEFLASPWASDIKPNEEEVEWLRSLPRITWLSAKPSNKAIAALIEARRSTK